MHYDVISNQITIYFLEKCKMQKKNYDINVPTEAMRGDENEYPQTSNYSSS
jgi:hypothetical protein